MSNDLNLDFQNQWFGVILIFKIIKLGDFAHLWCTCILKEVCSQFLLIT